MLLAILAFAFLVFMHELGHYVVGRYYGVGATDFSIGFGKKLVEKRDKRNTIWSIRLIPLGGFVAHKSRRLEDDPDNSNHCEGAFIEDVSSMARINIALAGPVTNLLLAVPLVVLAVMTTSTPTATATFERYDYSELESKVSEPVNVKLDTGDRITSVNGHAIASKEEAYKMATLDYMSGVREIPVTIERADGETQQTTENIRVLATILFKGEFEPTSTFSEQVMVDLKRAWRTTTQSMIYLPAIIGHRIDEAENTSEAVGGVNELITSPVMAVKMQNDQMSQIESFMEKVSYVLSNAAGISIALAFLNLLPFFPLDGGQVVAECFRMIRERLSEKVGNALQSVTTMLAIASVIMVLSFMGFAVFGDIYEVLA